MLLKASEGGGGKGIRKVGSEEECKNAFEQICAEVQNRSLLGLRVSS